MVSPLYRHRMFIDSYGINVPTRFFAGLRVAYSGRDHGGTLERSPSSFGDSCPVIRTGNGPLTSHCYNEFLSFFCYPDLALITAVELQLVDSVEQLLIDLCYYHYAILPYFYIDYLTVVIKILLNYLVMTKHILARPIMVKERFLTLFIKIAFCTTSTSRP